MRFLLTGFGVWHTVIEWLGGEGKEGGVGRARLG